MAKVLENAYARYNKKYFNGKLPKIPVRWSDKLGVSGADRGEIGWFCIEVDDKGEEKYAIVLSVALRIVSVFWKMTLLHEMAHTSVRDNPLEMECIRRKTGSGHSKVWKKEMRRLAAAGAFDRLW